MAVVGKLEDTVDSLCDGYDKLLNNQNICEEKIHRFSKMISDFKDHVDHLTVLINTDIVGKLDGILKFHGVSF